MYGLAHDVCYGGRQVTIDRNRAKYNTSSAVLDVMTTKAQTQHWKG